MCVYYRLKYRSTNFTTPHSSIMLSPGHSDSRKSRSPSVDIVGLAKTDDRLSPITPSIQAHIHTHTHTSPTHTHTHTKTHRTYNLHMYNTQKMRNTHELQQYNNKASDI